uniref:Uncharacterized protein n=1 Tax=Anopheles atroparvus TaxID=41427 RepID=A0A182J8L9_ANOAO
MQLITLAKRKSGHWQGNWKSFGRSVFRTADGTFHHAIAPVLLLAQCISLLPVVNVFSINFRSTRFKARSFRCALSLVYLLLSGLYCVFSIRWYIRRGLNISYFANCIYLVVVHVSAIFFFLIAMRWQSILGAFAHCERSFLGEHYRRLTQGFCGSLAWKIRFTGFALFALAFAEDWLNFYRAYESNIIQIETCNRTNVTLWENFYLREHPHVFHLVPFNGFTIAVTEWINRCMRYTWTYLDIFIISFSYGVQFRYEQIFRRLLAIEGMVCPSNFWSDLRMDYVAVSELVNFLDDQFGHLVLLACANDMYFIATQLFNGFQRRRAIANYVYFWYSLLLLIFRTITMLYVGSGVYVASMRPLHLLRNVSSKNWSIDLQRLTDEVSSGENILSGKQFFFLKRQIILALFSLFPLGGLFRSTVQDIEFRWISLRTLYAIYFFVTAFLTLFAHLYYSANQSHITNEAISNTIYYTLNTSGAITLFRIAIQWKTIMTKWRSLEEPFLHPPYTERRFWTLRRTIAVVGVTMLVLAFVEDFLHVASVYYSNLQFFKHCNNSIPFWTLFYEREHPKIFTYLPYNLPTVLVLEVTHKIFLFLWTFMDLFIIFVSLGLVRLYNRFHGYAVRYKDRHATGATWQQLRLDYNRISRLVEYMEGIMSPIVIYTTACDLYFIFIQMFNSFQFSASPISEAYFKFSLGFLMFRTLAMLLAASNVDIASLKPLNVLRSVPMSSWSIDVQRLTQEVINGRHCLSEDFYRPNKTQVCGGGGGYFCRTVTPVLIVGQLFGLLPVEGVCGGRWWSLRWQWYSLRNGYAFAVQLGALVMAGFSFATLWFSGVEFAKISAHFLSWMFFTLNLLITLNFSVLARAWPELMSRWVQLEQSLPDHPRLCSSYRRYRRQLRLITTILMTSALIEHVLSKPAGLHRAYRCPIPNLLEAHYKQAFPEMFSFVPYNPYVGFLAQTVTSLLTMYWNYVDLFLIAVSVGLRANLHHVNEVIRHSAKHYHRPSFWDDQCAGYRRVLGLIRHVNHCIGSFIVISYSSNLFFICIQLVNVFQQNSSLIVTTYCWYSLFHLIGRIVAVSLYGSAIHDEYCRTRAIFYRLPVEYGHRAEIAATVVTYELVLTQVNEAEAKNGDDNPCT